MITGLDHIVLAARQDDEPATYETLLGRPPDWRSTADGAASDEFRLENTALEILRPAGDGPVGDRLREITADSGPQLASLAFSVENIEETRRVFARRGLAPSDISDGASTHDQTGETRSWRRFRIGDDASHGVKLFVLERAEPPAWPGAAPDRPHALDHVVINTPDPDRALALYGAKLGLRLALDRTAPEWGVRLMFFRTGGLTVEIAHRLGQEADPAGPDRLWGLSWRVSDIEAARGRLAAASLDASDVRDGRKPGTRVFTAHSGTMNIPTLFIAQDPGRAGA